MSELLANWLGAVASSVDAEVMRAVGEYDSTAMGALLTCLHFNDVAVGDLGPVLGLTGSGAVRLVDRLERDGLLRRSAKEGRVVKVCLTPAGRRQARKLQRQRLAAIGHLLSSLSPDEQRDLAVILEKVLCGAGLDRRSARTICRFCDHRRCDGEDCPIGRSLRERGEHPARRGTRSHGGGR